MRITFEQLVESEVREFVGNGFIHLSYWSEPSMNKAQKLAVSVLSGSSEILPIEKLTSGQFQLGLNYGNSVNNRGAKEQGEPIGFVAAPLRWGKWVEGQVNKLIEHNGELYLRFYGLKNGKVESKYFVGGKPASAKQVELIKEFTERGDVKTQTAAGLTDNQVIARNVKLTNIVEITLNGRTLKRKVEKVA